MGNQSTNKLPPMAPQPKTTDTSLHNNNNTFYSRLNQPYTTWRLGLDSQEAEVWRMAVSSPSSKSTHPSSIHRLSALGHWNIKQTKQNLLLAGYLLIYFKSIQFSNLLINRYVKPSIFRASGTGTVTRLPRFLFKSLECEWKSKWLV